MVIKISYPLPIRWKTLALLLYIFKCPLAYWQRDYIGLLFNSNYVNIWVCHLAGIACTEVEAEAQSPIYLKQTPPHWKIC